MEWAGGTRLNMRYSRSTLTKMFTLIGWLSSVAANLSVLIIPEIPAIAQTTQPPTESTQVLPRTSTRPLLQVGNESSEVAEVQAMLFLLGFYRGDIDGRFGESTAIAVANFQRAARLNVDGIVGNSTWNSLLPAANRVSAPPPSSEPSTSSPSSTLDENTAPQSNDSERTATQVRETSTPTPSNAPTPSNTGSVPYVEFPLLRQGMQGAAVIGLQERLRSIGIYRGPVDGIFGPQTEAAVIAAQRQFNLIPDGVVGSTTWAAILQ